MKLKNNKKLPQIVYYIYSFNTLTNTNKCATKIFIIIITIIRAKIINA